MNICDILRAISDLTMFRKYKSKTIMETASQDRSQNRQGLNASLKLYKREHNIF